MLFHFKHILFIMDFLYFVFILYLIVITVCIAIMFFANSDILTFVCAHLGKNPSAVYAGKIVWVTGATNGIGEALAKELAKCNAKLVLSARRKNELDRVKLACLELNPNLLENDILVLPFDILEFSFHEQALSKIISHFGKLDVLVSNEGCSPITLSNWHEIKLTVDRQQFELNLFTTIHLNRIVVSYFLQKGGGQLAIVSNITGKIGWPNCAPYTGSQHALYGYFEGLQAETLEKNIDITLLCPGFVSPGTLISHTANDQNAQVCKTTANPLARQPTQNRVMTLERCASLCVVAMGNGLSEAWISGLPGIPLLYLSYYQPFLFRSLWRKFGASYFQQNYDNRNVHVTITPP